MIELKRTADVTTMVEPPTPQIVQVVDLDPGRLDGLFRIGVNEISWRKHHKYLTLVVDHDRGVGVVSTSAI